MKTHLTKVLEGLGKDEGHYAMRRESLERAMVTLRNLLKYTSEDAMADWESDVLCKSTEGVALNGVAEIQIESKYTKSGETEYLFFDEDDFILTVEE